MSNRPVKAFCLGCGYSLIELQSPKCPECGRVFNPRDESTWTRLRWISAARRLLAAHGALIEFGSLASAAALTLYGFLPPGQFTWAVLLATVCWLITLSAWTYRVTARVLWPRSQNRAPLASFLPRSLGTPLAAAICVYLVRSSIPLKWAFGAFYTDFSSAVQRSRVAGPTLPSNSNAGPYTLERRILTTDGTIYFAVSGDSQRDSAFFVYVPDQAIAAHDQLRTEGVVWKRLRRNWYLCIRSK